MSTQFSAEGPAFPDQLVERLLAGDVVFLCGAGVSAPQLPGFKALVESCFAALNVEQRESEKASIEAGRFEEALGSLERQIVDGSELVKVVAKQLQTPRDADLSHHRTLLRLSRDINNRPVIVTTNFDTLFEAALAKSQDTETVQTLSFAGQGLPAPGNAGFAGIIHLHGRIADAALELEQTPLVLTSAQYGDAYLRSGWASRFLFDLCRCKTIVLVGYSAGDAPVRYILNVLAADRNRFPDLHRVYALDGAPLRDQPNVQWEALAVEPIAYMVLNNEHEPLWRDLKRLADLVDYPNRERRRLTIEILSKPFDDSEDREKELLSSLLRNSEDLWALAIETIVDIRWLKFFKDSNLWDNSHEPQLVAQWFARHAQSAPAFKAAIGWHNLLGKPFANELSKGIQRVADLPVLWQRAWRLLIESQKYRSLTWANRGYMISQRLKSAAVLRVDVEAAIDLLTPDFQIRPNEGGYQETPPPDPPKRLRHLIHTTLISKDDVYGKDLAEVLVQGSKPTTTLSIATTRLESVIGLLIDLDEIDEDHDEADRLVPSVEPHWRNERRPHPLIVLVQLMVGLLPRAAASDLAATRLIIQGWRNLPGLLGIRLWLHAMRNSDLFSASEVASGLRALDINQFWSIRRELALVLRDRAKDLEPADLLALEQRIIAEGDVYCQRFTSETGGVDWRNDVRDGAVWLRLMMLQACDHISDLGRKELAEIKNRRAYLDRAVEDEDFFGSYMGEARWVVGNFKPLVDAPARDRLNVALNLLRSSDSEKQRAWRAYCLSHPQCAFETLQTGPLDSVNLPLWQIFTNEIAYSAPDKNVESSLISAIFHTLESAESSFLDSLVGGLCALYLRSPRRDEPVLRVWWPRLFQVAIAGDTGPISGNSEYDSSAIVSPGELLTLAVLHDIDECRKSGEPIAQEFCDTLIQAATAGGRQGTFAKAALIKNADFVLSISEPTINKILDESLGGETIEAKVLRAVLVNCYDLPPNVTKTFSRHILRGVTEIGRHDDPDRRVAAKIIGPALSIMRRELGDEDWGLSLGDVRRVLRSGPPVLRVGAINLIRDWFPEISSDPADGWVSFIGPLLKQVWPREKKLLDDELTKAFVNFLAVTKQAFPHALEQLFPYIQTVQTEPHLHKVKKSGVAKDFPSETLRLLWRLLGQELRCQSNDLAEILQTIITKAPELEADRRWQSLNRRAPRYT